MKKAYLVARREYVENLRTKTFWLGILFFPIILVVSIVVPKLLSDTKDVRYFAVHDRSGDIALLSRIERRAAAQDLGRVFTAIARAHRNNDTKTLDKLPQELRNMAPMLGELDDAQLAGFKRAFDQAIESLPADKRETFFNPQVLESMSKWVTGLDADEADDVSSGLSRSDFQLRDDIDFGDEDPEQVLRRMVKSGDLFAYFVIGEDPIGSSDGCEYFSTNYTDFDLRGWFSRLATEVVQEQRFAAAEIAEDKVRKIQEPLVFAEKTIGDSGQVETVRDTDKVKQWVPVVFVYLLWFAVFMIAQMLLTNTVEEKSNRTIEVLLSSVSPLQLMAGKIAGIAVTGLTVVVSWVFFFFVVVKALPLIPGFEFPFDLSFVLSEPRFLLSFVGYFLAGYLMLAALLVGIGSVCNSLKEAQNLMMPVSIVLVLPLLAMVPVGQDPNGTLARFLSYVPIMTPFVMMNRAAGPPPLIDYIGTTLLMLVTLAIFLWGAAKIFRIGILMTGKPPRIGEIIRWLRAPVGAVPVRRD